MGFFLYNHLAKFLSFDFLIFLTKEKPLIQPNTI